MESVQDLSCECPAQGDRTLEDLKIRDISKAPLTDHANEVYLTLCSTMGHIAHRVNLPVNDKLPYNRFFRFQSFNKREATQSKKMRN